MRLDKELGIKTLQEKSCIMYSFISRLFRGFLYAVVVRTLEVLVSIVQTTATRFSVLHRNKAVIKVKMARIA